MTMKKISLSDYLKKKIDFFEKEAESLFPETFEEAETVSKSMRYSFFAGGKRFRPVLAMSVCEALGYPLKPLIPACLAIEMIHTYSLIHDDLPAMDDDDFRRGKKSNHKVFGEAIAILAGDGLLTEAFNIAAKYPKGSEFSQGKLDFIAALSEAAGIRGMVGGQVMDISEEKPFEYHFLKKLHSAKTGAMIKVSALAPLYIFGDYKFFENIASFGEKLGMLFQITDDILDIVATKEVLGKSVGKDLKQHKLTYVTLFGLEEAKRKAEETLQSALSWVENIPNNYYLKQLALYVYNREK